jgi:hypothetical protein
VIDMFTKQDLTNFLGLNPAREFKNTHTESFIARFLTEHQGYTGIKDYDTFFDMHGEAFPLPKWLIRLGNTIYSSYPGHLHAKWRITSEQVLKELEGVL